jgi:hypothetical protein
MEKQEKQIRLFPVPEFILKKSREPLYYLEIIEGPEIYVYWKRAWSKAQAKKHAAREHNKRKGFLPEIYVKFGKVKKV